MKLCAFLLLYFQLTYSNNFAQILRSNSRFDERHFLFEVKQIDEFFERFNDDRNSFLRRKAKKYYPKLIINRPLLIKTLFDIHNKRISLADKKRFIETANDQDHPSFLNYYNDGWFAEAVCLVKYRGEFINISVLLKVNSTPDLCAKWMIYEVHSKYIDRNNERITKYQTNDSSRFISPMGHATNFVCLAGVFEDVDHIKEYFDNNFYSDSESVAFYHALTNKEISFQYVKYVRYHFFQVKGWSFTVDEFDRRSTLNSGWLISDLRRRTKNYYSVKTSF